MNDLEIIQLFQFFQNKQAFAAGSAEFDRVFCQKLLTASTAQEASIWRINPDGRLSLKYGTNVSPSDVKDFSLSMGEGITGAVAQARKTLKVRDAWSTKQHHRYVDMKINFRTHSMISSPILYKDMLYGVLNILNPSSGNDFSGEWEYLLESIAIIYAMALCESGKLVQYHENKQTVKDAKQPGKTVMVGISRCIQDVLHLSLKAGKSTVPVLISGDTGTGKELAARKIHETMSPENGPFLSINCAAITETIMESELFGHVKGAFSGAVSNRKGKFVAASGGTLFLDEISEMSFSCQAKILRALQEKTVIPVGSDKEAAYDARIIAATNRQLNKLVSQGKFRKDLYYRLCGLEIHIPELRKRPEDIPLLVDYFIEKTFVAGQGDLSGKKPPAISEDALQALLAYSWPGNVRQLEQAIMAAMAVSDNTLITRNDLPGWLKTSELSPTEAAYDNTTIINPSFVEKADLEKANIERDRYLNALEKTRYKGTGRWNISAAARILAIPRKTFVYRMKKLNMQQQD